MKIKFLLFSLFISGSIFSQNIDYKYLGSPYYPEQILTESDSLSWPIDFYITIDVKDIKELTHNSTTFIANFIQSSYSNYPLNFISETNDTINLNHSEWFQLYSGENNPNNKYISEIRNYNNDEYPYLFAENSYSKQVQLIESPFYINWNLRNFPFDNQKLILSYKSTVDTSIINLKSIENQNKLPSYKLPNLLDGFRIESITVSSSYNTDESDIIQVSPEKFRPIVTQSLNFELNVDRNGSSLFIKLFLGGILSFLISAIIFLIDIKDIQPRVTLAVGAIFGAIGNRYYIDSILPEVQVLTKADAISNLIIFMVFFNILIMVLQHSKVEDIKFFQTSQNSFIYSLYSFTVLFLAILLW